MFDKLKSFLVSRLMRIIYCITLISLSVGGIGNFAYPGGGGRADHYSFYFGFERINGSALAIFMFATMWLAKIVFEEEEA